MQRFHIKNWWPIGFSYTLKSQNDPVHSNQGNWPAQKLNFWGCKRHEPDEPAGLHGLTLISISDLLNQSYARFKYENMSTSSLYKPSWLKKPEWSQSTMLGAPNDNVQKTYSYTQKSECSSALEWSFFKLQYKISGWNPSWRYLRLYKYI